MSLCQQHDWVRFSADEHICQRCGKIERLSSASGPAFRSMAGVTMWLAKEGAGGGDPYHWSIRRDASRRHGMEYVAEYGCGCTWEVDPQSFMMTPRSGPTYGVEPSCPIHRGKVASGVGPYDPSATYPTVGYALGGAASGGSVNLSLSAPSIPVYPVPLSIGPSEPRPELELTFETEPVVGIRMWRVVTHHLHGGISEPRLQPLTGRSLWEPRERYVAQCLPASHRLVYGGHGSNTHEAPDRNCDCGTWAVRDQAHLPRHDAAHGLVAIGEVYLWGRVLEFKKGYRAKYAYPKSLTLMADDRGMADELARVYGVPVECDDPGSRYSMLIDEAAGTGADPLAWLNQYMATFKAPTNPAPIMLSTDPIDPPTTTGGFLKKALDEATARIAENEAKLKALERAKKPTPPRQKPTLRDAFKRR